jgi:hypothetical protein
MITIGVDAHKSLHAALAVEGARRRWVPGNDRLASQTG